MCTIVSSNSYPKTACALHKAEVKRVASCLWLSRLSPHHHPLAMHSLVTLSLPLHMWELFVMCSAASNPKVPDLIVALFLVHHVTAMVPGHEHMAHPAEIPDELWSYYASLTKKPSCILSFGYQIASAMVSRDRLGCCFALTHQPLLPL